MVWLLSGAVWLASSPSTDRTLRSSSASAVGAAWSTAGSAPAPPAPAGRRRTDRRRGQCTSSHSLRRPSRRCAGSRWPPLRASLAGHRHAPAERPAQATTTFSLAGPGRHRLTTTTPSPAAPRTLCHRRRRRATNTDAHQMTSSVPTQQARPRRASPQVRLSSARRSLQFLPPHAPWQDSRAPERGRRSQPAPSPQRATHRVAPGRSGARPRRGENVTAHQLQLIVSRSCSA